MIFSLNTEVFYKLYAVMFVLSSTSQNDINVLQQPAAILMPLVTLPSFTLKSYLNNTLCSRKIIMSTSAANMQKTTPSSHISTSQLRPGLGDMTHFQDGPRFCEIKIVHKPYMYFARLTGSYVPCWPCSELLRVVVGNVSLRVSKCPTSG